MTAIDPASLNFEIDLQCEFEKRPLSVVTAGRTIVVDLPDVATGLRILKLGSPRYSYRDVARQVDQWLLAASMTLDVRVGGEYLGTIGGHPPNTLWKAIGLPPMKLKPMQLLRQFVHGLRCG